MVRKLNYWSVSVAAALSPSIVLASDLPNKSDAPSTPSKKVSSSNPFEVSVTGAGVFSDFRDGFYAGGISKDSGDYISVSDGKMGLSPDTRALGAYGAISIGRKMDNPDYDWKVTGAFTHFEKNKDSVYLTSYYDSPYDYYSYDLFGFSETEMGFQTLDFDLGHRFNEATLSGRVFGGFRALHMSDSSLIGEAKVGTGSSQSGSTINGYGFARHDFVGIGPRIGAEAQTHGKLAVKGSVAAAVLYGQSNRSFGFGVQGSYDGSSYGPYELDLIKDTSYDWVTDVEGSLGVVYSPSNAIDLEAGYRGEYLAGVDNSQQENVLAHGPYLKVGVKF